MAEYLLSVHTTEGETSEPMAEEEMREFMQRVHELEAEMKAAGAWVYGGRLQSADSASVVRVDGGETLTTDGPFAETKEHLGGFYIVNSEDIGEALSWASKTAACVGRPIEVRPFFQTSDAA
jgi:hypothetical protein